MSDHDTKLIEEMWHKVHALYEGQKAWANVPGDVAEMKIAMSEIKADLKEILDDHQEWLIRPKQAGQS